MLSSKETLFQRLSSEKDNFAGLGGLRYNNNVKIIIFSVTVLICSIFFSIHFDHNNFDLPDQTISPGFIWQGNNLVSEYSFPVYKIPQKYEEEKNKAIENVLPVFSIDNSFQNNIPNLINEFISKIVESNNNTSIINDLSLSESMIKDFNSLPNNVKSKEIQIFKNKLNAIYSEIYQYGFINTNIDKLTLNEIEVYLPPNQKYILKKSNLTDRAIFLEKAEKYLKPFLNQITYNLALEFINRNNNPNLYFSKDLTDKSKELAIASITRTSGLVRQNELLIAKGEKVTEINQPKIKSYFLSKFMKSENYFSFSYYLGALGHSALILSILVIYLVLIRQRIYRDNFQVALLCFAIVLSSLLAWLSIEIPSEYPLEFLIVLPAFSMLIAIVFDSRTAFYITITMAMNLAGIRGNDYTIGMIMIFAGTLAAYTVRDIQSRTQMFRSIFFIFIGLALPIIVFGLERSTEGMLIFKKLSLSAINSTLSPLITFGLLFILERTTNIATDLRIKEFDDLNHPLLVKMAEIAPGTYQHTLSVALLAERCAREIEANHLLVKAGAYFHDIGKMVKPEYFTENQIGISNKHEHMSAKKSARIIIDHVEDAIEMAKQYKLPQRIIDFIPMHHGTSLVKHFYAKALEENVDGKEINENDFRYPGPKPNSKETAILMICDFAEAISRLDSRTIEEIEDIIDKNINNRIADGQFDDCNITIEELKQIKHVIAKTLIGTTHKRVNYKEIPQKEESLKDFEGHA